MLRELDEWFSKVKAIEREYTALRLAATRLQMQAEADSNIISKIDIDVRDILNASRNLEGTYLIRLFAEFETALRLYWATIRNTHPKTEDLVNGVASRRKISYELIESVHGIREYRNSLVHEREDETTPVSLSSARSTVCQFLGRLPDHWS